MRNCAMILPPHVQATIEMLKTRAQMAFARACRYDDIPVDSQFVVFSEKNPHADEYDLRMREYMEYCRKVQSGSIEAN